MLRITVSEVSDGDPNQAIELGQVTIRSDPDRAIPVLGRLTLVKRRRGRRPKVYRAHTNVRRFRNHWEIAEFVLGTINEADRQKVPA